MSPVFQGHSNYLSDADLHLGSALQACDALEALEALEKSLLGEESAARRGKRPLNWVLEQPTVFENGAAALAQGMKAWDMEKEELREQTSSQLDIKLSYQGMAASSTYHFHTQAARQMRA